MFSRHSLFVGEDGSTPERNTIFSQSDLTMGKWIAEKQIASTEMFRMISVFFTSFRKQISASCKIRTISSQGVTRPPLVLAAIN